MRRWILTGKGVETIKQEEVEAPKPAPGEVLVRVATVSLNYRDWAIIQETYPLQIARPLVLASDMAGTVVEVGQGVSRFGKGDRVTSIFHPLWKDGEGDTAALSSTLGGPLPGVLTEYRTFPEDWLLPTPAAMSDAEASTLPIAPLTAWFALVEDGGLRTGQSVLAQGSGGVSIAAIQIAKAKGARVLVTSGSPEKSARLRELGADVVIERGKDESWADAVLRETGGEGVDQIVEVAGGKSMAASLKAVRMGGHIAVIGFLEHPKFSLTTPAVIYKRATIRGVAVGHRRSFERMLEFFEKHRIHPVIERDYSFQEVPRAFEHLGRGAFGKVVIRVGE